MDGEGGGAVKGLRKEVRREVRRALEVGGARKKMGS